MGLDPFRSARDDVKCNGTDSGYRLDGYFYWDRISRKAERYVGQIAGSITAKQSATRRFDRSLPRPSALKSGFVDHGPR
jgi:hypothetical protein